MRVTPYTPSILLLRFSIEMELFSLRAGARSLAFSLLSLLHDRSRTRSEVHGVGVLPMAVESSSKLGSR